jgi:hypothetical protein
MLKPTMRYEATLSRRAWLHLSAGALLSAGMLPGCARFADNGRGGAFRFVAIELDLRSISDFFRWHCG